MITVSKNNNMFEREISEMKGMLAKLEEKIQETRSLKNSEKQNVKTFIGPQIELLETMKVSMEKELNTLMTVGRSGNLETALEEHATIRTDFDNAVMNQTQSPALVLALKEINTLTSTIDVKERNKNKRAMVRMLRRMQRLALWHSWRHWNQNVVGLHKSRELSDMAAELSKANDITPIVAKTSLENEELRIKLIEVQKELASHKEDLTNSALDLAHYSDLEREFEELTEQHEVLNKTHTQLSRDNRALKTKFNEVNDGFIELKTIHDRVKGEFTDLSTSHERAQQEVSALQSTVKELESVAETHRKSAARSAREKKYLEEQLQSVEAVGQEVTSSLSKELFQSEQTKATVRIIPPK